MGLELSDTFELLCKSTKHFPILPATSNTHVQRLKFIRLHRNIESFGEKIKGDRSAEIDILLAFLLSHNHQSSLKQFHVSGSGYSANYNSFVIQATI